MAKVLLIDDEADLLVPMEMALSEADHEVTALADGAEALGRVDIADFDLVITDIVMPRVDGLEALRVLRHSNPDLKVIAMSGGGLIDSAFHLRMAEGLGAVRTLTKPFPLKTLVQAVEDLLGPTEAETAAGST